MSILDRIVTTTRKTYEHEFSAFSPAAFVRSRERGLTDILPLMQERFFLIAEVKKGSPSKGIIREQFDPVRIAASYEQGGASAISVLTEEHYFFGSPDHLRQIGRHSRLPLLRKDFIVHPCQIYEAYNLGADFILLIVACLDDHKLRDLYDTARSLELQVLVEVHNETELKRALQIKPAVIGINNRDLNTFTVDITTSFRLKRLIPDSIRVISESGITSHQDIVRLKEAGFSGALVGESLLRSPDTVAALRELRDG